MANDRNLIPDSIAAPWIKSLDDTFAARFNIGLDQLLVYLIDTINSTALPWLAEQFDVAGYKGYLQATDDAARRAVIKQAILLKRHMGTVYAIRQALASAGYGSEAVIHENSGTIGDGHDWARFEVIIDLGGQQGVNSTLADEATRLINIYKNARSFLTGIDYTSVLSDDYDLNTANDEVDLEIDVADDGNDAIVYKTLYLDGSWRLDGTYNLDSGGGEVCTFQIE